MFPHPAEFLTLLRRQDGVKLCGRVAQFVRQGSHPVGPQMTTRGKESGLVTVSVEE